MQRIRSSSKSGLFLMELIIAIAFFAFSSAICIQLFAKAHTLSQKSADQNFSVSAAQSAAECFKATGASHDEIAEALGAVEMGDSLLVVYYDENWNHAPSQSRYTLWLQLEEADGMATARIAVSDDGQAEPLYELTAKKYIR